MKLNWIASQESQYSLDQPIDRSSLISIVQAGFFLPIFANWFTTVKQNNENSTDKKMWAANAYTHKCKLGFANNFDGNLFMSVCVCVCAVNAKVRQSHRTNFVDPCTNCFLLLFWSLVVGFALDFNRIADLFLYCSACRNIGNVVWLIRRVERNNVLRFTQFWCIIMDFIDLCWLLRLVITSTNNSFFGFFSEDYYWHRNQHS